MPRRDRDRNQQVTHCVTCFVCYYVNMKLFRIIVAAPFVLIGALFYQVAEWISGEIYVRHEKKVRENVIFEDKMYQRMNYNRRKGSNRTKPKKRKK